MSEKQDFSNFRGRRPLKDLSAEEVARGAALCVEADRAQRASGDYADDDYAETLDIAIENAELYGRAAEVLADRMQKRALPK